MGIVFKHGGSGIRKYTVTVTNGSGSGIYKRGEICTATASVPTNYRFSSWSNGATSNPYSFAVTSNIVLTASFIALPKPGDTTIKPYTNIFSTTGYVSNPNPTWPYSSVRVKGIGTCRNGSYNRFDVTKNYGDTATNTESNRTITLSNWSWSQSGFSVYGRYTANTAQDLVISEVTFYY